MTHIHRRIDRLESAIPKAGRVGAVIRNIVAPDGRDTGRAFARLLGTDRKKLDQRRGEKLSCFRTRVDCAISSLEKA